MNERAAQLIVSYRARKRGEIEVGDRDGKSAAGVPTLRYGGFDPESDREDRDSAE